MSQPTNFKNVYNNASSFIGKNHYTTAFLIIFFILIALGSIYYFRMQDEQREFISYRFRSLQLIGDKWEKLIENFEEQALLETIKPTTKPKKYSANSILIEKSTDSIYYLPIKKNVDMLNWRLAFDEFILLKEKEIIFQSFDNQVELNKTGHDPLKDEKHFKSGHLDQIKVNEETYQLYTLPIKISVFDNGPETWYLQGFVLKEHYDSETRRLDVWIILLLSTLLLLIIMGFPLIKLIFINEIERLNRRDVILAGISVIIGTPIIILIFLSSFYYAIFYYHELDLKLEELADDIEERFNSEIISIVNELDDFDLSKIKSREQLQNEDEDYPAHYKYAEDSIGFKFISLVDKKGEIELVATLLNDTLKKINLKKRPYFKRYDQKDFWQVKREFTQKDLLLNPEKDSLINYVLSSVMSVEKNEEEAIILLEYRDNKNVVIASTKLGSVHDAILQPGYQFAIIDREGKAWFHSEPGRSTLENFIDETRGHSLLKASLDGEINERHLIDYHGQKHLIYIKPIRGTTLSVITLYDINYLRLKVSEILSLGSIAVLIAFVVTGLFTVVSIIKNSKGLFFKYKEFRFTFLEPKKKHMYRYLALIIAFVFIMVCTIVLISIGNFRSSFVFTYNLLLMIWGYLLVYYVLNLDFSKYQFKGALVVVFLVVLNLFLINIFNKNPLEWSTPWFWLFALQVLFIALILGIKRVCNDKRLIESWLKPINFFKNDYKQLYIVFLLTWLILTSIFPAGNYFVEARQIENVIWAKHEQLKVAKAIENKLKKLPTELPYSKNERKLYEGKLDSSIYLEDNLKLYDTLNEEYTAESSGFRKILWMYRPIYGELIAETQPFIYLKNKDSRWFWEEKDNILSFRYKLQNPPAYFIYNKEDKPAKGYNHEFISLTTFIPEVNDHISKASFWMIFLFVIFFLLLLISFYFLIRFFVNRIFGLSYLDILFSKLVDNSNIHNKSKSFHQNLKANNLFLVGVANSGKRVICDYAINYSSYKSICSISIMSLEATKPDQNIDEVINERLKPISISVDLKPQILGLMSDEFLDWSNYDLFIIEYFEHGYKSAGLNNLKLELIQLLQQHGKRIIILSDIYTSQILEFYQGKLKENEEDNSSLLHSFITWRFLLGSFVEVIHELDYRKGLIEKQYTLQILEDFPRAPYIFRFNYNQLNAINRIVENVDSLSVNERYYYNGPFKLYSEEVRKIQMLNSLIPELQHELSFGTYLPTLCESIVSYDLQHCESVDDLDRFHLILHINSLAKGYYNNLWNSLSRNEKYLVYDLASDGFVNYKNNKALYSLIKKGIVRLKDKLILFNRSFRNHVLNSIDKEEALLLEKEIKTQGSWGFVKVIIYIIILGIVGFLFLSEPALVEDFSAFLGVLAGIATIMPVLSGFLGGKAM